MKGEAVKKLLIILGCWTKILVFAFACFVLGIFSAMYDLQKGFIDPFEYAQYKFFENPKNPRGLTLEYNLESLFLATKKELKENPLSNFRIVLHNPLTIEIRNIPYRTKFSSLKTSIRIEKRYERLFGVPFLMPKISFFFITTRFLNIEQRILAMKDTRIYEMTEDLIKFLEIIPQENYDIPKIQKPPSKLKASTKI